MYGGHLAYGVDPGHRDIDTQPEPASCSCRLGDQPPGLERTTHHCRLFGPLADRRTFYQDGKGLLGLDEYRMRNAEAIQKHWCLVFVAYSFLHLDCLPPSPTKGNLPIKTIGEACRQQAQALMQALMLHVHDQLQHGLPATEVFARLFAKQGVAVPT